MPAVIAPIINAAWVGLTSAGFSGAFADVLIKLGGSILLNAASRALAGKPKQQQINRELSLPTTTPAYRFVYGTARAMGTPAGVPIRGEYIYGCWILNSRPSAGPFSVILDKREAFSTGDPYDFTMDGGAIASVAPFLDHVKYWIGRGDQTSPPAQFLAEAPWAAGSDEELWLSTDAWQGRTVIWMRLRAGKNGQRLERWPAAPPMVEVDGNWSLVWDMRDEAQDPDDADTWEWSDNHALCTLDALRTNPVRAYRDINLHLPSWEDAADVADETQALKSGGSEPRYRLGGTLVFDTNEIEDQIQPMVAAGAADLIRIGGQLGIAAGAWRAPSVTLSDLLDSEFRYGDLVPGDSLPTEMRVSYTSAARGYETAELAPWPIPGALSADGGVGSVREVTLSFIQSATQAMRVRKILGLKARRQRSIAGIAPPSVFDSVGGSTMTVAFPSPYTPMNGTYEVIEIHPAFDPVGATVQFALRCPVRLLEHTAAIYAWTPAADEEDVVQAYYDPTRSGVSPPGAISVITGAEAAATVGSTVIPRIRFAFDPSPSVAVDRYDWEVRLAAADWEAGGSIDGEIRDGDDQVFGYVGFVDPGATYEIRVRAMAGSQASAWVTITGVIPTDPSEVALADLEDPGTLGRSLTVTGLPDGDAFVTGDGVWWRRNSDGQIITAARWVADSSYSQYQIDQVPRSRASVLAHARASTGTYVDDDGVVQTAAVDTLRFERVSGNRAALIEAAATNLALYSQDASNVYWSKTGVTVTADATTAPDGTMTADRLFETAVSSQHKLERSFSFTSGVKYGISCHFKANGRDDVTLLLPTAAFSTTPQIRYNLTTLAATLGPGTPDAYDIETLADGWFRVWMEATANITSAGVAQIRIFNGGTASYLGDITKGVVWWGAQLEPGGYSSYIPTGASTVTRAADVVSMQGLTATLDVTATYGDGTTGSFAGASVVPGYWPALTKRHLRRMAARTP